MARYIHCEPCKNSMLKDARKLNELYEFIEGAAISEMHCDGCYDQIKAGEQCFAAVLLPDKYHHLYKIQRPEFWMKDLITPIAKSPQ